jgi:hypothetical protein
MLNKWLLTLAVGAILACTAATGEAGWFGVGVNIGIPVYPGPYYRPYYYPYYQPYPVVYVAPPPVSAAPVPVYVQQTPGQPPAVVRSAPPASEAVPAPQPLGSNQVDVNRFMQLLNDGDERVRSDAAMDLGRLKAQNSIDMLCNVLATDKSSLVRESAARALGLIAAPRSLNALQNAAQADSDRDVRRSAQFSAEVIRANLR